MEQDESTVEVSESDFRSRMASSRTTNHPAHWPPDVREISLAGLSILGLDSKGQLYLDGDPVYTVKRWSRVERIIAIVGVGAALIGAAAALFSAVVDAQEFGFFHQSAKEEIDQSLKVLRTRVDDGGAVAVSFPGGSTRRAFLTASGVPVEIGLLGFEEKAGGYRVTAYFGNLSSAHLGNCHALVSVANSREGGAYDLQEVNLSGYFKAGEASVFGMTVPAQLRGADQITLSKLRCDEAVYQNGFVPEPLEGLEKSRASRTHGAVPQP